MRVSVAAALLALLACAAGASARKADDHERASRFAMRDARVEPVATVADERFQLQGKVVRYGGAETTEALGFRLQSRLLAKGAGCTVPAAIFADGFE